MKKYDYLVIGTGAANITTDAAIDAGKTVAVIEKGKFGGTYLNRGCIHQTLVNSVDYKWFAEQEQGLIEGEFKLNWTAMGARMWNHLNHQSSQVLEAYSVEEMWMFTKERIFHGKSRPLNLMTEHFRKN